MNLFMHKTALIPIRVSFKCRKTFLKVIAVQLYFFIDGSVGTECHPYRMGVYDVIIRSLKCIPIVMCVTINEHTNPIKILYVYIMEHIVIHTSLLCTTCINKKPIYYSMYYVAYIRSVCSYYVSLFQIHSMCTVNKFKEIKQI